MTSEQYDLLSHIAQGAWTKNLYFRTVGSRPPIPFFHVSVTEEEGAHYLRVLGGVLVLDGTVWRITDSQWIEYMKAIIPMIRPPCPKWIFAIRALEEAAVGGNAIAAQIKEAEFRALGIAA